jgi:hypothetical protein
MAQAMTQASAAIIDFRSIESAPFFLVSRHQLL